MTNECPYCSESYSALKNHIRLTAGGGHGSSGSYPSEDNSEGEESIDLTQGELADRLVAVSDRAYEAGREEMRRENERSHVKADSTESNSDIETGTVPTLPVTEEPSEDTSNNWLAAAGGIAALTVLKQGLSTQDTGHHRERM